MVPLEFNVGIGDPIYETIIYNSDSSLAWKVSVEDSLHSVAFVEYGMVPKNYKQEYPEKEASPAPLTLGEIYYIELKTKTGIFKRRFIYDKSEVYMDLD